MVSKRKPDRIPPDYGVHRNAVGPEYLPKDGARFRCSPASAGELCARRTFGCGTDTQCERALRRKRRRCCAVDR